jgi:pimeloyl-ACP methyl ester carboxylesterase
MSGFILLLVTLSTSRSFAMGVHSGEPVFKTAESAYEISWRDDVKITAHDGVVLAANVFVPKTSNPAERFPVVLMASSWDCEEHEYYAQGVKFCERGYIVLEYSPRGWGISTGLVNVGGPDDMKDISSIINYLVNNYPVDGVVKDNAGKVIDDSKAKIGMCGVSYGGGFALLGAAHDQRVKAAMGMVPWGDLGSALYLNQTPKKVWHHMVLLQTGELIGNLDPMVRELTEMLFSHDHQAYYDTIINWAIDRSPIGYLDELNYTDDGNPRDIAICISSNLEDEMFPPNATLDFFYGLKTPKKRMDINRGIHASAEGAGILGMENTVWNKAHAWMDEHLKGVKTGIMDLKPMSICDKNNGDRYYADHIYHKDLNINYLEGLYDTADNVNTLTPEKYYLGVRPDGRLYGKLGSSPLATSLTNTIVTGDNSGINTGTPVISSILEAHTNFLHVITPFALTSRKKAIVYASEPLTADRRVMGTPHVKLNVTCNKPTYQLVAHLYKLDAIGNGTLISHGPLTILSNGKFMPNAKVGQKLTIEFNLITTCATVKKGERIALAIDTEDPNYGTAPDTEYEITFGYNADAVLSVPFVQ